MQPRPLLLSSPVSCKDHLASGSDVTQHPNSREKNIPWEAPCRDTQRPIMETVAEGSFYWSVKGFAVWKSRGGSFPDGVGEAGSIQQCLPRSAAVGGLDAVAEKPLKSCLVSLFAGWKLTDSKMLQLLPQIPECLAMALPSCSARCFLPSLSWLRSTGHIVGRSCFVHSGLGPSLTVVLCRIAENRVHSGCQSEVLHRLASSFGCS